MLDTADGGPTVTINRMRFGPGTGRLLGSDPRNPNQLGIPGTNLFCLLSATRKQPTENGLVRVSIRYSSKAEYPPEDNIARGLLYRVTGETLEKVQGHAGYATLRVREEYILAPPGLAENVRRSLYPPLLEP